MGLFDFLKRITPQTAEEPPAPLTKRQQAIDLINRGNASEELGRIDEAMALYDKAIALAPDLARAHMNKGNIFLHRNDAELALTAYQRATELDPDYAEAYYSCGNALTALEKHDAARLSYEKAILLKPDFVDCHFALGCLLEDTGNLEEAVASYRTALDIRPEYREVQANLGRVLVALKRSDEGMEYLRQATPHLEEDTGNLLLLGLVEKSRGKLKAASQTLSKVHAAQPTSIEAIIHLGDTYLELRQASDAINCYRKALEIEPYNFLGHNNLGNVYFTLGSFDEAEACYRRALEIQPDSAAVLSNLGAILKDTGEIPEAIRCTRRAIELLPEFTSARSNLLFIRHLVEGNNQESLLDEAKAYGGVVARLATPVTHWANEPTPDRRLRIGLVSGDLCFHPVGFFIEGVLRALSNRPSTHVEIFAYMNCFRDDPISQRIRDLCHQWREIFAFSDDETSRLIQNDRIDILMDLSGHSGLNRLPVFAWKPAPIQVSWLGYFDTTGVKEIDYLIADSLTLPSSEEAYFTEKIWRLPHTRLCFTPPDVNVTIGPLPALSEEQLTFGCFNNLGKMGSPVVALWARVLAAVPRSRLFLKARQLYRPDTRTSVIEQFAQHGIDPKRLILEGPESRSNYLAAYNRVDIALDPFPYTGGTTTAEALWMGVPVLTLAGPHFLQRQGIGLLVNAGLPEWVANSEDDYVTRAISLASNLADLAALRSKLRAQVLASPIFDADRFAMHLEQALRGMWHQWCKEQRTKPHSTRQVLGA